MPTIRPELEALPERMKSLPIDERGYPVPWFVDWISKDGVMVPEFRAMDLRKWMAAVKERRCWVCGQRLGVYLSFLIGPMCGISRSTSEPPCHLECAEWSARNCPFLSRPHMTRRDMEAEYGHLNPGPGIPILRNPGVSLVWTCRDYEVFSDGKGGKLIHVGDPEHISFWAEGKPATRDQILESVETGLPNLVAVCQSNEERTALADQHKEFMELLPA